MADKFGLPRIIAVDFDGTLVTDAYPKIGYQNYHLMQKLLEEKRKGTKLILWTCRGTHTPECKEAVEWCRKHGLEFDTINENLPEVQEIFGYDTRKVYATEYWDDKAVLPSLPWAKGAQII